MTKKAMAAVAIGAVGIVALGACSSGSDQSASDRDAAPASPSAPASPTATLAMPASASENFEHVFVSHVAPSKCNIKETDDKKQLIVSCTEVGVNFMGDQVFVGVPNDRYRINVRVVPTSGDPGMQTTQRDWANMEVRQSDDNDVTWNTPYKDPDMKSKENWGVGIDSRGRHSAGKLQIVATVSYLGS